MRMSAISSDTPCVDCGYNLRGLTTAKRCPECGTLVATTFREMRAREAASRTGLDAWLRWELQSLTRDGRIPGVLLLFAAAAFLVRLEIAGSVEAVFDAPPVEVAFDWGLDVAGGLTGAIVAVRLGLLGFTSYAALLAAIAAAYAVTAASLAIFPALEWCATRYVLPCALLWWLLDLDTRDIYPVFGLIIAGRAAAILFFVIMAAEFAAS